MRLASILFITGAILLGACASQQQYPPRKVRENNLEQYFSETREEKRERRIKEKRFSNKLINTGKADRYSSAQIACSAISLREQISESDYIILKNRYEECMRNQIK